MLLTIEASRRTTPPNGEEPSGRAISSMKD
jgi:hypothetical protein